MACACLGSASPFQRIRNFSASVLPSSTVFWGTTAWLRPRADWAAYDRTMTASRPMSSRACSSVMS